MPPGAGADAWRRALVGTLVLWGVVLLVTVVAGTTVPALPFTPDPPAPGFPGWPVPPTDATGWPLVRDALVRFDALYYLGIAADGYPAAVGAGAATPSASAFLPAYPALVAATGLLVGGRLVLAAGIVSTVATVLALVGLQRLVEELGAEVAGPQPLAGATARVVVVTLAFPTAFHLLAPYAESVHLAAVVWALVHAARGRPLPAAALGALAAASRPLGILLVLPLLIVPAAGSGRRGTGAAGTPVDGTTTRPPTAVWGHRLVAAAGPPAGLAVVALVAWWRTGDPLAPVAAQARWLREWQPPWTTLGDAVRFALGGDVAAGGYYLLDLLAFVVAVVAVSVLAVRAWRAPASSGRTLGLALAVHGVASVAAWLWQVFPGRPLMSVPRFALVVPAVLVGLALATSRPGVERAWLAVSSTLLGVSLLLFSRWYLVF